MRNYIFALLLLCGIGFSQTNDTIQLKKNSVFIELLGNSGGFYSINYDRIIAEYDNSYLNLTVGLTPFLEGIVYGDGDDNTKHFSIPVTINYTSLKKSNSHFELGAGLSYSYYKFVKAKDDEQEQILFTSRIGYKYQRPQGGFNFKIALTPTFPIHVIKGVKKEDSRPYLSMNDVILFLHYVGIGAGYTF